MNKLLITLLAGLFAASLGLNAVAAETAKSDAAPAAEATKEKPAAPAKKAHKAKKEDAKKDAAAPAK